MKIPELRKILKETKEDELRYLVVEFYKAIPKAKKEDMEIDDIIQNVSEYAKGKKKEVSTPKDIDALQEKIEFFIANAYQQNYFRPNRIIPKKERPKWRFTVKQYYKDLNTEFETVEQKKIAAQLLEKLYRMLCYGCIYYIFNTNDPFASVGIDQRVFLDTVITKTFAVQKDRETIRSMIDMTTTYGTSNNYICAEMTSVLLRHITKEDALIAIEEADKQRDKISQSKQYVYKRKANNLVELILLLYILLEDASTGAQYFKKNYIEERKEEMMEILLFYLELHDEKETWIKEYKEATKKRIKIDSSYTKKYAYLKAHDEFPEE